MKNNKVKLCVFRTSDYGTGITGFLAAFRDGAVYPVEADYADCSYSVMYSVQASVAATAKCIGPATIEMGVYREQDSGIEYVSLDEIDRVVSNSDSSYNSIVEGFENALAERQTQKQNLALVANAYQMLNYYDSFDENLTFEKLMSIGKTLDDAQLAPCGATLRFDSVRMIWVGKPTEPKYAPDCSTGLPKAKISMHS